MSGVWKTFFIYLPFLVLLMIFYWSLNEVTVEYPIITVNDDVIMYDINYKYKTTLVPFIYDFTKEGRQTNYSELKELDLAEYPIESKVELNVSDMQYPISNMYIVYEGETSEIVYEGNFKSDITPYLSKAGKYRIALFSKLYRRFYYNGYVDYKFKIEVLG